MGWAELNLTGLRESGSEEEKWGPMGYVTAWKEHRNIQFFTTVLSSEDAQGQMNSVRWAPRPCEST